MMSIQQKIGVGIIGLRMGRSHLESYVSNPRTEVKGICDLDDDLLGEISKSYNIPAADKDYRKILERGDIDLISVATPDLFHRDHCIKSLEAGKDVLCEKPLAVSRKDCREIIDAVKRTKKKLMVGQVCRFAPGFVFANDLIKKGVIGELFLAESEYAHDYQHLAGFGDWRKKKRDPVIGGGCHAIDLLRWICGDVEEVCAYGNHEMLSDWDIPHDTVIANLNFLNKKIIGKVMISISVKRPYTMRSLFYGSEGTIIADNTSPYIQLYTTKSLMKLEFAKIPVDISSHNVSAEIEYFLEALLDGKALELDAIEGANTVAATLAITESAKNHGKSVGVDLFNR
jgi:predicted dehydrogenase